MRDEEREQFLAAMHLMRDAFAEVRQLAGWQAGRGPNDQFFDGYQQVKQLWRHLLLEREVLGPDNW